MEKTTEKAEKINFWEYYSKFSKRNKIFVKKNYGNKFQIKKNSVDNIFARKNLNFEEITYICELVKINEDEFTFEKPQEKRLED